VSIKGLILSKISVLTVAASIVESDGKVAVERCCNLLTPAALLSGARGVAAVLPGDKRPKTHPSGEIRLCG